MGARSDDALVAAVRAGDDAAFERLYERYQRRVAYYVYGMVRDYGRAEDIAQEVFMSALRRIRQTDRPIAFKPWIYEIAKNACIDQYRRSQRRNEVSFEDEQRHDLNRLARLVPTTEAAIEQKLSLEDLCGAFTGLSEVHHQVLVLRELEGHSYEEIGRRLDMTRPAVESTLFRARRRLAAEYEELVTGERCRRVRAIVAACGASALGARDRRRLAAHVSHCQSCRRHAYAAGVDLETVTSRPARGLRKIGAWLPLPLLFRRRDGGASADVSAGSAHSPAVQWAAQIGSTVDPSVAGWARAAFAAATVALAGVGAGSGVPHVADALLGSRPQPALTAPGQVLQGPAFHSAARQPVAGRGRSGPADVARARGVLPSRRSHAPQHSAGSSSSASPPAAMDTRLLPKQVQIANQPSTPPLVRNEVAQRHPLRPVKRLVRAVSNVDPAAVARDTERAAQDVLGLLGGH